MALRAISRKLSSLVVRVCCIVIVALVAAVAGIWCIVIVSIMAIYTIQRGMSSSNNPVRIMIREEGRIPAGSGRMATYTVRRK